MGFNQAEYFEVLINLLKPDASTFEGLNELAERFKHVSANGGKILIFGNGGSAAIASHLAVDLNKNAGLRALTFNEASFLTGLTNDFGQEQWPQKSAEMFANPGDIVVVISSSGTSGNMVNLTSYCLCNDIELVSFTGMRMDNPIRSANAKGLNFFVDSEAYNHIETVHQTWLLFVVDVCIGSYVYKA